MIYDERSTRSEFVLQVRQRAAGAVLHCQTTSDLLHLIEIRLQAVDPRGRTGTPTATAMAAATAANKRGGDPGAPARFARRGPNPIFLAGGGCFWIVGFLKNSDCALQHVGFCCWKVCLVSFVRDRVPCALARG